MKIFQQTITKEKAGLSKREFLHMNANFLLRRCAGFRLCKSFSICKRNGIKIRLKSIQARGKCYEKLKQPNFILQIQILPPEDIITNQSFNLSFCEFCRKLAWNTKSNSENMSMKFFCWLWVMTLKPIDQPNDQNYLLI